MKKRKTTKKLLQFIPVATIIITFITWNYLTNTLPYFRTEEVNSMHSSEEFNSPQLHLEEEILKSRKIVKQPRQYNSVTFLNEQEVQASQKHIEQQWVQKSQRPLLKWADVMGYNTKGSLATLKSEQNATFMERIRKDTMLSHTGFAKPINLSNFTMPSQKEIEDLYSDQVLIKGLDQCSAYRDRIAPHLRFMAVAGLHNTGTNALYKLLQSNCYLPERWKKYPNKTSDGKEFQQFTPEVEKLYNCSTFEECEEIHKSYDPFSGIRHMVPWWKHGPAKWRYFQPYYLNAYEEVNDEKSNTFKKDYVLPLVMIKDPIFWMNSMCRNPYEVKLTYFGKCPNLKFFFKNKGEQKLEFSSVLVEPPNSEGKFNYHHKSLLHMWNEYYQQYMDASYFRLIIRFEDLIYRPKRVISNVCSCAGGIYRGDDDFKEVHKPAKYHGKGAMNYKKFTNLKDAQILYGSKDIRKSILTDFNRDIARDIINRVVLDSFRYSDF